MSILGPFRTTTRAAATVGWTASMLGASLTHARLSGGRGEEVFDRYERRWCHGLLQIVDAVPEVEPAIPALGTGARLVVSNHRSTLDIPVLLSMFGGSALSRADLADWPLLGRAAKAAQTIFVDRSSPRSGVKAIRAIREQLKRGRTVSVFPEGTTYPGDEVRPFRAGALAAARSIDVEIVPVGLAYASGEFTEDGFMEHAKNLAASPRTRVAAQIGAPRQTGGASVDPDALRDEIQSLVDRARERL